MESRKVGSFTIEAKEWNKLGISRIYFHLLPGTGQACWDDLTKRFIKCRNRVNARWEHAIKEAFELGD